MADLLRLHGERARTRLDDSGHVVLCHIELFCEQCATWKGDSYQRRSMLRAERQATRGLVGWDGADGRRLATVISAVEVRQLEVLGASKCAGSGRCTSKRIGGRPVIGGRRTTACGGFLSS